MNGKNMIVWSQAAQAIKECEELEDKVLERERIAAARESALNDRERNLDIREDRIKAERGQLDERLKAFEEQQRRALL